MMSKDNTPERLVVSDLLLSTGSRAVDTYKILRVTQWIVYAYHDCSSSHLFLTTPCLWNLLSTR